MSDRLMRQSRLGALVAVAISATAPGTAQLTDSLDIVAKRFYTGDGLTRVDAFVGIPFSRLTALAQAEDQSAVYRIAVQVSDSSGVVVTSSSWTGEVPRRFLGVAGVSTVEHFAFAVPDGRFDIHVEVTDSASGGMQQGGQTVRGYASRPYASDLLLTNAMRSSASSSDLPAPGEIQKGSLFLSAAPRVILSPRSATLYYYLECYPGAEMSLETVARVVRAVDGHEVISTPSEALTLTTEGGVVARALDLAGLPQGEYELRIEARYPDRMVVRTASFEMMGFEQEMARTEARDVILDVADPFADISEGGLDSLYDPLLLIMESTEGSVYGGLSVEGKRRYLRSFWERRDPTPATSQNEVRDRFYEAVAVATRRFHEGGAGEIPGWRTDRGRIFLKHGEPDDWLVRPQQGRTEPYEVWKYTRGRPLKFVFYDETGFGHFALIYTDDRTETGRPNWQSLLGAAGVEDVLTF